MLKHLTFALSVALLPACTVVSDDTDGNSNSNSNSATDTNNPSGATTSGTTTDTNPTSGTTTDGTTNPTGTTTDTPTTDTPTTDATTVGTMTTSGTTSGTTSEDTEGTTQGTLDTDTDTGGGLYGNCGWNVIGYYACLDKGGVPGTEDPMMLDPIACPQDIMEGAMCDDMGMGGIGSVGCCTPEGVNYFCDIEGNKKVFKDDCAM